MLLCYYCTSTVLRVMEVWNLFFAMLIQTPLKHTSYFSCILGLKAWASGNLDDFGKLISASGRSSIENYECGK
ncbi:hypothetical protein GW17_00003961 [Ensete ventricosum]|uniref:Uncharacterized protein n=1 Tax=Ensete ventricosum TaxID=4639 RepID=A0A444G968_ENSVE|nr:hypothetical protein GW17_00003961 [Ensete ventricosum]RZR74194.1 hypothetical protein BHM03_00033382 [Ensete ventricosum]